ncbi:hypothetical protein [Xylanibacter caecicola]|nr:hypothetical protein [Xylanibacter caecicola]
MLLKGTGRFAANRLVIRGNIIVNGVVEIENGTVRSYYHFSEELPFTEWIGGTIELFEEEGVLAAYAHD